MAVSQSGLAVVTGASSGIGGTFARKLAARGYDLLLTARREDRLRNLAHELSDKHGINATFLGADLTVSDDLRTLERRLATYDSLTMLVNNAGFGAPGTFVDTDLRKHLDMIKVHITAAVRLTHAALPGMMRRGRGDIINVSSMASLIPHIVTPSYTSTKVFLNNFSVALQEQVRGFNVRVQSLCPGYTYTEFHDQPDYGDFDRRQIPSFLWMSADEVVERSLNNLDGKVVYLPGFYNRTLIFLLKRRWLTPIVRRWMKRKPK